MDEQGCLPCAVSPSPRTYWYPQILDFNSITTITSWVGLLATLSTSFIFLLISIRTKSFHVPMYRLWKLLHGTEEIEDQSIKKLISDETSLMHFRFMYGIQLKNLTECHRLINWSHEKNIEMVSIARCGVFFDPITCAVRNQMPNFPRLFFLMIIMLTSIVITSFTATTMMSDGAILKLKESQRYFWLAPDYARPLWPLSAIALSTETCNGTSAPQARKGDFSIRDQKILCDLLEKSEGLQTIVSNARAPQQWLASTVLLIAVYFGLIALSISRNIQAARVLKKRLDKIDMAANKPT